MRAVILERNRKRPPVPSKILPSSVIMVLLSDSRNIRVSIKSAMMSTSYQGNVHKCNEFQNAERFTFISCNSRKGCDYPMNPLEYDVRVSRIA